MKSSPESPAYHIGKAVETRLAETGLSKADLGRKLQITRQNVCNLLKKAHWDAELLLKVSRILQMDFFGPMRQALASETQPLIS